MNEIFLYGASGHAKVIVDIVEAMGCKVVGLIDDNESVSELLGIPVCHSFSGQSPLIISIGSNGVRKMLSERLDTLFAIAVHPSAIVSKRARINEGTVVMQEAIIQSDANIGRHCIINTGASIDHECRIGDFVHISPHATLCGNVRIGEGTWVGAGATIIQGVKIGRWAMIGAGSVVTKDIPDGWLAVGNRCKLIKQINQDKLNSKTKMGGGKSRPRRSVRLRCNEYLLSA